MSNSSKLDLPEGVKVTGEIGPRFEQILSRDALAFVAKLDRAFAGRRLARGRRVDEWIGSTRPLDPPL